MSRCSKMLFQLQLLRRHLLQLQLLQLQFQLQLLQLLSRHFLQLLSGQMMQFRSRPGAQFQPPQPKHDLEVQQLRVIPG